MQAILTEWQKNRPETVKKTDQNDKNRINIDVQDERC